MIEKKYWKNGIEGLWDDGKGKDCGVIIYFCFYLAKFIEYD